MNETRYVLEVQPQIPERLSGLSELANNLLYSWERSVRGLFYRLDYQLWERCGHNPKVFLRRVSQKVLDEAAEDHVFMEEYGRVMASYETYKVKVIHGDIEKYLNPERDLIAYFCAEFGLYESLPIYSGGLGILAGDYCKAASDLGVPFIGVGLMYRQGYFIQTIDGNGHQTAHAVSNDFNNLPIEPCIDAKGKELQVTVEFPGRDIACKVWRAQAGHITLYLLDSDLPANRDEDRSITFQLYGGDRNTRIQQEILLGIGGVRALRALGFEPNIWHINEGHAAFQILERCREQVAAGMDFASALELVAAGTVFTTHTPVPAGHDIFAEELMTHYFSDFADKLGIDRDSFLRLGRAQDAHDGFNTTSLALRGSRFHNGVSRIHGDVASRMETYIWPQIAPQENPIGYVTNGVHVPTFLAREWVNLFDMRFREWRNQLLNDDYWHCIDTIPDHRFWSLRQELKARLLDNMNDRILQRHRRNGSTKALMKKLTHFTAQPESDVLVIGFARRFATYKRATLLFQDPQRLARLLNDPDRPVVIIFAGKAHPSDGPGQELIRTIHEYSMRPEFLGKIILLEGYDMNLARLLVTGVDVWLNNPEYPLEASGTSGQKAAINGVINLSVLDGWWGEGYNGENGWAIEPHDPHLDLGYRNTEEGTELLDLLEHKVIPTFYKRGSGGYSADWVKIAKASMKSCIPRFNAQRMMRDYVTQFYVPAKTQYRLLSEDDSAPARELAAWKTRVKDAWNGVHLRRIDPAPTEVPFGKPMEVRISAQLNGLAPEDVAVECLMGCINEEGGFEVRDRFFLSHREAAGEEHEFALEMELAESGLFHYKLRMYPYHRLLSHPFEMGRMLWL